MRMHGREGLASCRGGALVSCLALLFLAGCATRYLEKETPPGAVPPPRPIQPAPAQVAPPPATGAPASAAPAEPRAVQDRGMDDRQTRTGEGDGKSVLGGLRAVVFATHRYTGDVNEWKPGSRAVAKVRKEEIRAEPGKSGKSKEGPGASAKVVETEANVGTMRAVDRPERKPTDDEIVFERSFVSGLQSAGLPVVDRDVIVREEATRHQGVNAMEQVVLSRSVVETYALDNHVDLLVTIDMLGDPAAPCTDRRFVASAKRVKSGEILATVDSAAIARELGRRETIVATSSGYRKRVETTTPGCAEIARTLARKLAQELASAVGRGR